MEKKITENKQSSSKAPKKLDMNKFQGMQRFIGQQMKK